MRWPWPFSLLRRPSAAAAPPPSATRLSGDWGEERAADFLRAAGYKILGRNIRFGSRCELDIVARSPAPETLVFVEVKTRATETYGRPIAAVNALKRRALGHAAHRYLRSLRVRPPRIRFDVVEVVGTPSAEAPPVIRHIPAAFTLGPHNHLGES